MSIMNGIHYERNTSSFPKKINDGVGVVIKNHDTCSLLGSINTVVLRYEYTSITDFFTVNTEMNFSRKYHVSALNSIVKKNSEQ